MKFELNKVYRARDSTEWKVVCMHGENIGVFVNKNADDYFTNDPDREANYDLIELVGDDFTSPVKELREVTFEAYLREYEPGDGVDEDFAVNKALKIGCTHFYSDTKYFFKSGTISKWEVTMKELPMKGKAQND